MSRNSISTGQRGIAVLGASGLIGSTVIHRLGDSVPVQVFRWSDAPDFAESLASTLAATNECDVIVACGITNPQSSREAIRYSNTEFPQNLIQACERLSGIRFITLGTVMEHFPGLCANNPYLDSKRTLGEWIATTAARAEFAGRLRHVRLHTIYGGGRELVKPHMFLGQIMTALEQRREFRMSSGEQLREYHHVEDIADSLIHLRRHSWSSPDEAVLGIHSGKPVRLADLARAIFKSVDAEHLLKIGSISSPTAENLNQTFPRSPDSILVASREPIAGVVEWVKGLLAHPRR